MPRNVHRCWGFQDQTTSLVDQKPSGSVSLEHSSSTVSILFFFFTQPSGLFSLPRLRWPCLVKLVDKGVLVSFSYILMILTACLARSWAVKLVRCSTIVNYICLCIFAS